MRQENLRGLTLGDDGRGQALQQCIVRSPRVAASGLVPWTTVDRALAAAKDFKADFVMVGPEAPLEAGTVDALEAEGIAAIGPNRAAAQLETNKLFGLRIAEMAGVPVPAYRPILSPNEVVERVEEWGLPIVVKKNTLARGQGVTIAHTGGEAMAAVRKSVLMSHSAVIQKFLPGPEVSLFFFCDGTDEKYLGAACDQKQLLNGNHGPMTGGMGAWTPTKLATREVVEFARTRIVIPTLEQMAKLDVPQQNYRFRGVLYVQVKLVEVNGVRAPYLIEFNARLGNPEAQALLALLESDIVDYLLATRENGMLTKLPPIRMKTGSAVCVSLAQKGYPKIGSRSGYVVGTGATLMEARSSAYQRIAELQKTGKLRNTVFRTDIALAEC